MATEVTMPKMGYDMTEGTILAWRKAEGEPVAKGDILGEIETGKVNIEIEAFDAGILRRIVVGPGETVPVGAVIAIIGGADEPLPEPDGPAAEPAASVPTPASDATVAPRNGAAAPPAEAAASVDAPAATAPAPSSSTGDAPREAAVPEGRRRASPLARRLAAEKGVDLARVSGSGPGGRILRDDVVAAASRPASSPAEAAVAIAAADAREPLSRMRRTIATRLGESWREAPHIFLTMAIEMDAAMALRAEVNAALEAGGGGKVSLNDLVVKAAARALRAHPKLNASWADGDRIVRGRVNVGVAVALDDGLITLTLPDADARPLSALAAEMAAKAARARAGALQADDLAVPSTFTISNLGMYGIEDFTAILNPPEACILAVGAALPAAVVRDGEVVVRTVMKVTLSADHRVVDGASAAEFLVTLKGLLERPLGMLI